MDERRDATIEEIGAALTEMMAAPGPAARREIWKIEGYDDFDDAYYSLPGEFGSREEAEEAADAQLAHLAESQPGASDGFFGSRDRVYIVSPDGERRRHHGGGVAPSF